MNEYKARVWVPLLGSAFFAIWFVASLWNGRYTWGFDLLQFFPLEIRLLWLITGIIILFVVYFHPEKLFNRTWLRGSATVYVVFLLIIVMCFVLLRSKTVLLGDGTLRLQNLESSRIFSATAPLTTLLHNLVYRTIVAVSSTRGSARLAYAIISIISGLVAAALYREIAKKWFPQVSWYVVILLLGLGLNAVFYCYVENYALFIAATWCYLWLAMNPLLNRQKTLATTLMCGLCISLHAAGLFLIPSLLVMWWHTLIWPKRTVFLKIIVHVALFIAVPLCTLVIARLFAGQEQFSYVLTEVPRKSVLPLWQNAVDYSVLSGAHLFDIGNQLLLIIPGGVYLLTGLLVTGVRVKLNKQAQFLTAACVGALCFLLFMNPELGMRRDWDAFAWAGTPLVCALLFVMKKHTAQRNLIPVAAVVSLWLFLPWVGVNASENRAVERYKRILNDETKLVAYGYGDLALHYKELGRTDLEEWAHYQAAQREPENAKAVYSCGKKFLQHGKPDSAVRYLGRAVMLDSLDAIYWSDYGTALVYVARYEEAISSFHKSLSLDSTNSTAYASLGAVYLNLGQWQLANTALTRAYKYGADDAWFYMCWAGVQLQSGQYKQAMHSLEKALRRGAPRRHVMPLLREAEAAIQEKTRKK